MNPVAVVHYAELGLKGGNRRDFERKLMSDVRARLGASARRVRLVDARVLVDLAPTADEAAVRAALDNVFGVAWYALGRSFPWNPSDDAWTSVEEAALAATAGHADAKSFKVFARRAVKNYPRSSPAMCVDLGRRVAEATGLKVDLESHDLALHVEVLSREICVFAGRAPGLRGLPQGSSGEALCLFSGGIDSPVAAWLLMRRGARVHLLHFHPYRRAEEVRGTKIFELDRVLRSSDPSFRHVLVPHDRYQVAASLHVPTAYETVFFRRFMFRAAETLARALGCKAVVTGDSLGQVASQTLDNLNAVQTELTVPVFQPLIAMDKESIIELAQKIGTYAPSILPYKDCCSLLARKPKTNVSTPIVRRLEAELDVPRLVDESLAQAEVWDGRALTPFRWPPAQKKTAGPAGPAVFS